MLNNVNFQTFSNDWYRPGNILKISIWYFIDHIMFNTKIPFPNALKCIVLKLFGTTLGKKCI